MSTIALAGERFSQFEVLRVAVSASVNTTATSSGTATQLIGGTAQFAGGTYILQLFAINLVKGTTNLDVELWVDGVFNQSLSGHLAANTATPTFLRAAFSLNPGVHTISVRGFVDAG